MPMPQRCAETFVDRLRFVVPRRRGLPLALEALPLAVRVVQLRVRVADLLAVHEELEALRDAGLRAVPLRERRHDLRVLRDEDRLREDAVLDEVPAELVQEARAGARGLALDVMLHADLVQRRA